MSLGVVFDVTIGLVFTYLLLALLASGLQEMIAGYVSFRGRQLRDGMKRLLTMPEAAGKESSFFDSVWGHSLIQGLHPGKLPSYLPAQSISVAIIDALMDGSKATIFSQCENTVAKMPDGRVKSTLTSLLIHAGGDLDALKSSIERLYDDAMDRLSGTYKRYSQCCLVGLGLLIALSLNVDSVRIADTLWNDEHLRATLVQQAEDFNAAHPDGKADTTGVQKAIVAAALPIGWADTKEQFKEGNLPWVIMGWVLTAVAISLGAPFWFDALGNILRLRSAGAKPARADDSGA
jgi:hypothetical protein